jgi:hypothetical protein
MERSEFTLDEGFHFRFYDPESGLDFTTDTAGDWTMAFKRGKDYRYRLADMASEPVIHTSYPDMVRYTFLPFRDIRVESGFLVHSSHLAMQEIRLTNTGRDTADLKVYTFLRNPYRTFNQLEFRPEENAVFFSHEELPDSWVLGHGVPYVQKVEDFFLSSVPPDRMTGFRSYRWGEVVLPHQVDLGKASKYRVHGRMHHTGGERCRHQEPPPRLMAWVNGDLIRLVNENAPCWGTSGPNVTAWSYYGVELGHFSGLGDGDRYTVLLTCPETGTFARVEGVVRLTGGEAGERRDVTFTDTVRVLAPPQVEKDVWGSGREVRLYWKPVPGAAGYHVYRRDYRKEGVLERVAGNLSRHFFTDKDLAGDPVFGYVVVAVDSLGNPGMASREINNIAGSDFLTDMKYPDQIATRVRDLARVIAMEYHINLNPGESRVWRVIRGFARDSANLARRLDEARSLFSVSFRPYAESNERLFSRLPAPVFRDADQEMLWWSAFNLMRQVMLPPEGQCGTNYYVFSREPAWGWGHGGQVFHESLTMLAYAYLDPMSAMDSQRVFSERQHRDGYINYRTGPYLNEIIETDGEKTSSAPWYAWQNWEVYRITGDRAFLKEMYVSSRDFYRYYVSNRDGDGDGLCEWGAHAVLESVRDAYVAVWDQVVWPARLEALDANCMLVMEARALENMARELGRNKEARAWQGEAEERTRLINETFWDDSSGFYFHVDGRDNDFTYTREGDLKREEIIGFLPLWAGVASPSQAARLVEKLTDPEKFWRRFGVPSLAADDPYYNPKGYWNGPVWVEWNALIVQGLLRYGYGEEARELVERVASAMITQLRKDHNLWEFYSPDEPWAGYHKTYIWAGIIARMMMDVSDSVSQDTEHPSGRTP